MSELRPPPSGPDPGIPDVRSYPTLRQRLRQRSRRNALAVETTAALAQVEKLRGVLNAMEHPSATVRVNVKRPAPRTPTVRLRAAWREFWR